MAERNKKTPLLPLKRVIIFVADVEKCARFYIDVFGFSVVPGDDDWNARINDARTTTLAMILSGGLKQFGYVYDFGDNWEHRIVVENVKPAEEKTSYPEFLGGERRCPPEDCGGIPGYYDFLDKIVSKQGKKRKAALDWYGGPYDPDDIDEQQIIINLRSSCKMRIF